MDLIAAAPVETVTFTSLNKKGGGGGCSRDTFHKLCQVAEEAAESVTLMEPEAP